MEARAVALCQRRQGTWLDVTELRGAGQVAMVTAGEGGALGAGLVVQLDEDAGLVHLALASG